LAGTYLSHEKSDSIQIIYIDMGFLPILRSNTIYCCFDAPDGSRGYVVLRLALLHSSSQVAQKRGSGKFMSLYTSLVSASSNPKNAKPLKECWRRGPQCHLAPRIGLAASQKTWSGYHRRSLVENQMHHFKLLGPRVMARDFDRRQPNLQCVLPPAIA